MKKIVVLLLLALVLAGCGKKSGMLNIENKSNYDVICGIGEDYKTYDLSILSGETKQIAWKQYILWYPKAPINLISYKEADGKVIIMNNNNTYKYAIRNNVTSLTLIDNNRYILADNQQNYIDKINIPLGESEVQCFQPLQIDDIIFDQGDKFTINNKQYNTIEKIGSTYYYNTNNNGVLNTKKITITIVDKIIIISIN